MAKKTDIKGAPDQDAPNVQERTAPNVRLFRHKETGEIHEADYVWARTMEKRTDLIEIEPEEDAD